MNAPFMDPKTAERRRKNAKFRAALVNWHRRIGVTAALFVLILSVTGIILSHAERLKLHESTLAPSIADALYDTTTQSIPVGLNTRHGWLVWIDGTLYQNGLPQTQAIDSLNGVVETDDIFAIAGNRSILLYMANGEFIERLNEAALPGIIGRIGIASENHIILETDAGLFGTDPSFLEWTELKIDDSAVDWSTPTTALPPAVRDTSLAAHGTADISMHRFMSDLHSGRTFGPWGPFIMDAAAIFLIFLSLTGCYIWWRQRRARMQNKRLIPPAE